MERLFFIGPVIFMLLASLLIAPHGFAADDKRIISRTEYFNNIMGIYEKHKKDPIWKEYADELRKEGDEKYIKQDYSGAARDYYNAWPNLPEPYYFIMYADAYFRFTLKGAAEGRLYRDQGSCWKNMEFAFRANHELSYRYEMGFDIASALKMKKFISSPFYTRADKAAVCLRGMVAHYSDVMAQPCVDLKELKACLGDPLITR